MTDKSLQVHGHLTRGFGLLQSTALNISNVVGVGPFITIPLMLATMGGPQALLGWISGALLAICDGQVWSELGSVWPGSGGSYRYLKEAYGPQKFGSLLAFLFIWQFILSGPLEISSGMIGFSQYASFLWPAMLPLTRKLVAAGVGVIAIIFLYRRTTLVGKLALILGTGTLVTMIVVIFSGLPHFDAKLAFSFPPGAFSFKTGFFLGLGSSMLIAMYDYLGYYDVCYIGDEVRDPGRTIPRSILLSAVLVCGLFVALHMAMLGVVNWHEVPLEKPEVDTFSLAAEFMKRLHDPWAVTLVTVLLMWSCFGSAFAGMLAYSRIPFGAARYGHFFGMLGRVHPNLAIPHISLLFVGILTLVWSFFGLQTVIDALVTTRILEQFVAQCFGVVLLRWKDPDRPRPYRMWLYPLPCALALVGWLYMYLSARGLFIALGLGTLGVGVLVFSIWSAVRRPAGGSSAH